MNNLHLKQRTSIFTPVFGVIFSGILILGEAISPNLILALIMVSLGMVLVNYRPSEQVKEVTQPS